MISKQTFTFPLDIKSQRARRKNDVVLTSMRRNYVASTFIRRHFGTLCPLGSFSRYPMPIFVQIDLNIIVMLQFDGVGLITQQADNVETTLNQR